MNTFKKLVLFSVICALILIPMTARADSIDPSSFSATLNVGESVTITKTVTIDDAPPTTALVDVLFMFDTTRSMTSVLSTAVSNAGIILSNASGLGDVEFGVAHYEDFPEYPYGSSYNTPYALVQDLTDDAGDVQTALSSLSARGGMDYPESQLYALHEAADDVSWRTASNRIIVWFGDAPGHDGDLESGYPTDVGLSDTISALNAENITVAAINVQSYTDPNDNLDDYGQATAIATATGGSYASTGDPNDIVDLIQDALEATFEEYNTVELDVVGDASGVDVSIAPSDYTGDYDRSEERTFGFRVTFTGETCGVYDFEVHALVDGGAVAIETDTITVPCGVPEPSVLFLLGSALFLGCVIRRKRT
jgi:hypothetical protein